MSAPKLSPKTEIDELRGQLYANLPQVLESIDTAHSHYEVFKDLGLTPENIAIPTAQTKMRLMHKALRSELHPDKVVHKLKGGETEDEKELLRKQMEERFKKLQEAYEVLSDQNKRNQYNNTLKKRVSSYFHAPESNPSPSTQEAQLFQALVALDTIETAFELFVKGQVGNEASAETMGYASRYVTDPKTGRQMLELSFPDEKSAHQFIQQLLAQGMISSPWQALQQASQAKEPEPRKTEAQEDSYRSFELPQLKPQLKPYPVE